MNDLRKEHEEKMADMMRSLVDTNPSLKLPDPVVLATNKSLATRPEMPNDLTEIKKSSMS